MSFLERVQWALDRAAANDSPEISAAADQVADAVEDTPYAVQVFFRRSCASLGRADASTWDRIRFDQVCTGWAEDVRAAMSNLGAAFLAYGDNEAAEVVAALSDEVATMEEQADDVLPTRQNFELPRWLFWAVGIIAASEVLNAWSAFRGRR